MTVLRDCTCLRCGHGPWWPRTPRRPRVCPACHNYLWDVPRRRGRDHGELTALLALFGDRLPPRTRAIAEARASGNGVHASLRVLGERYGISGARVHQIERAALQALRRAAAGE